MKKFLLTVTVALATAGMFTQSARAVLINFDTDPGGFAIATGTNINTTYSSLGVTFGCSNGNSALLNLCSGNAFANASVTPASSPNVISLTAGTPLGLFTDERFGFFTATFSSAVNFVSIDAMPVPSSEGLGTRTNAPFLQAFGAGGVFLDQFVYPGIGSCDPTVAGSCPYKPLSLTRATNDILFVAFSSFNNAGPTTFGEFDNLNFSRAGGTVPEPSTLALLAIAMLGLSAARVRRS